MLLSRLQTYLRLFIHLNQIEVVEYSKYTKLSFCIYKITSIKWNART